MCEVGDPTGKPLSCAGVPLSAPASQSHIARGQDLGTEVGKSQCSEDSYSEDICSHSGAMGSEEKGGM